MYFGTELNSDYLMTCNNMAVGINLPPALKSHGSGDTETAHGLPPYAPRRAFLVDEYPACPAHWMRSSGRTMSYFVAVKPDHGLWLDFNQTLTRVANDAAIVISAQGVNAITGLPCKDPQLEQYIDDCPKHKIPFGPNRFCKACGYRWPKQNYLSSTGTPNGQLWLDGFRADDGMVRQYVLTEEQVRGVAKAIVGEERVFALGLSFFLSKQLRPQPVRSLARSFGASGQTVNDSLSFFEGAGDASALSESSHNICTGWGALSGLIGASEATAFLATEADTQLYSGGGPISPATKSAPGKSGGMFKYSSGRIEKLSMSKLTREHTLGSFKHQALPAPMPVSVKNLEIGAGAKINQRVWDDPNSLDFWQTEPTALVVVNYCSEEDAERIITAGRVDLKGSPEGFLVNVPAVGNPQA